MAVIIYSQKLNEGDINALASEYLDEEKGVKTVEEAIQGAMDIIAETISDNAEYRRVSGSLLLRKG